MTLDMPKRRPSQRGVASVDAPLLIKAVKDVPPAVIAVLSAMTYVC